MISDEQKTEMPSCIEWKSDSSCSLCEPNNYIQSGKCTTVNSIVDNCYEYKSLNDCKICNSGFQLKSKVCEPLPNKPNCIQYTNYRCDKCKSGYFLNENLLISKYQKLETDEEKEIFLDFFLKSQSSFIQFNDSPEVCQEIENENCLIPKTYNLC